jgi:hypothetical protein
MYDISTGKFTIKHTNQGHWGPYVYEGCKRVRNGGEALFVAPNEQSDVEMRY